MTKAYFITGTDTGVGKTVLTALLAAVAQAEGRSVCVYKPIQTGSASLESADDLLEVNRLLKVPVEVFDTYIYTDPVTPYIADEAGEIKPKHIVETAKFLQQRFDVVLVEGAGGVRVPVAPDYEMLNLMKDLALPVILVARPDLGTINHTLLSAEVLLKAQVDVANVVVANYPEDSKDIAVQTLPEVLQAFLPVELLYALPHIEELLKESGVLDAEHPVVQAWQTYGIV